MLSTAAIVALFAAISLSSAQTCPSDANFKLQAQAAIGDSGVGGYLTPGYPCTTTKKGCYAFFTVNNSTGFEYTIDATNNLVIATAPEGSKTPAGLFASSYKSDENNLRAVTFSTYPASHLNCTVAPATTGDGCMLDCSAKTTTSSQRLSIGSDNEWYVGSNRHTTETQINVLYA